MISVRWGIEENEMWTLQVVLDGAQNWAQNCGCYARYLLSEFCSIKWSFLPQLLIMAAVKLLKQLLNESGFPVDFAGQKVAKGDHATMGILQRSCEKLSYIPFCSGAITLDRP